MAQIARAGVKTLLLATIPNVNENSKLRECLQNVAKFGSVKFHPQNDHFPIRKCPRPYFAEPLNTGLNSAGAIQFLNIPGGISTTFDKRPRRSYQASKPLSRCARNCITMGLRHSNHLSKLIGLSYQTTQVRDQ